MKAAASVILFAPFLTSFVLLGKKSSHLPATPESPTITFNWSTDGKAPELRDKDKFKDGAYANYTDAQLTPVLIQEAMDQWNTIRGSYLRFQINMTTGVLSLDKEDRQHDIVVKKAASASVAAYAAPNVPSDSTTIEDCDIVINDVKTSALSLLETVTHELGHCVGLGHPHNNYGAIMSYSRSGKSYRLSADDKAGAIYLYPDPDYVHGEPDEMVSCGAIRGQHYDSSKGPWLYWLMSLPLLAVIARRRRRASKL